MTSISCSNNTKSENNKQNESIDSKNQMNSTEISNENKLRYQKSVDLREKYLGLKYKYPESTDFISKYGSPETLKGTDNQDWLVYFPEGDFTVLIDKKTDTFKNIYSGNYPEIKNDVTVNFLDLIGKKIEYYDYSKIISSIKYGKPEKLGMTNCLNKKCIEYYPKGNFTTVTFTEFTDDGDFVTLQKIGIGKIPNLKNYE